MLPPPYRSFNLAVARSTVCPWLVALLLLFTADDDGFRNIGKRGVFTMLAQLTPIAGDSPSREATPPPGRGERKAGLLERAEKSVLCERDDLVSKVIPSVGELSRSATWPSELTPAHVPRSPALKARAGADMRWAVLLAALSLARCWASVAAASLGLPTELAESGDKEEEVESRASDWRFVALVLKVRAEGELGMLDLSPGDLRFILASLASIWHCMEPPTAGLRRAVMGSDLAICCRTVMKKRICT